MDKVKWSWTPSGDWIFQSNLHSKRKWFWMQEFTAFIERIINWESLWLESVRYMNSKKLENSNQIRKIGKATKIQQIAYSSLVHASEIIERESMWNYLKHSWIYHENRIRTQDLDCNSWFSNFDSLKVLRADGVAVQNVAFTFQVLFSKDLRILCAWIVYVCVFFCFCILLFALSGATRAPVCVRSLPTVHTVSWKCTKYVDIFR